MHTQYTCMYACAHVRVRVCVCVCACLAGYYLSFYNLAYFWHLRNYNCFYYKPEESKLKPRFLVGNMPQQFCLCFRARPEIGK